MKVLVLGDIHGRTIWKSIINQDYDQVIFAGDYVDSHDNITGPEQFNNLHDIIEFKQTQPDKVILLVGNHDFSYWPGITETCSGYQPNMASAFKATFEKHQDLFQACYVDDNQILYSHAGFTEPFLDSMRVRIMPNHINGLFKQSPQVFGFFPGDNSGYGSHVMQSCLWVRPDKLRNWKYPGLTQVVGHTYQQGINIERDKKDGIYFIDALEKGESLIIEDGQFKLQITAHDKI